MRYALILGYSIYEFTESNETIENIKRLIAPDLTPVLCEDTTITTLWTYCDGNFIPPSAIKLASIKSGLRVKRNELITKADNLARRYERQVIMGITTTNNEEEYQVLLAYIQALCDFINSCDPLNPVFPVEPTVTGWNTSTPDNIEPSSVLGVTP